MVVIMKVLIACEYSGTVRDAFRTAGHDAVSCDLLPTDVPGPHYQGDVFDIIGDGWDLMVCHPPCTYLCSSGLHWNTKRPERAEQTELSIEFALALMDAPIEHIVMENPIGCLSSRYRKPDQIIQPYEFGHDASKATCLWLKNLPLLMPTEYIAPRFVDRLPRWGNQTDSGQNNLPPTADRWKIRSETYAGIAKAMAEQWNVPANYQLQITF
jgi:hypothetical protein